MYPHTAISNYCSPKSICPYTLIDICCSSCKNEIAQ